MRKENDCKGEFVCNLIHKGIKEMKINHPHTWKQQLNDLIETCPIPQFKEAFRLMWIEQEDDENNIKLK